MTKYEEQTSSALHYKKSFEPILQNIGTYEKQILIHKNFVALPFHPDTHVWSHPDFTESSIL